jgi:hypothetical protein
VRIAPLILIVAISGCATAPLTGVGGDEARATWQSQSSSRTTRVGLPLTRAQKIGLWSGVAVLIAYLMADDDDAEESPTPVP